MAYVQNKENVINLKEENGKGELVHKEMLDKVQNAQESDQLLFNELMNMMTGDPAMTRYISQNIKRSGLENGVKCIVTTTPTPTTQEIHTNA